MNIAFVLAVVFLVNGWIYESDCEVWQLDGKVVTVERDAKGKPVKFTPLKPTRKDDGTCPNCRVYTEKKLAVLIEPSEGPK